MQGRRLFEKRTNDMSPAEVLEYKRVRKRESKSLPESKQKKKPRVDRASMSPEELRNYLRVQQQQRRKEKKEATAKMQAAIAAAAIAAEST